MTTTPDDVTHQSTTGDDMTSSSSRGIAYYFESAIVCIGVVGTAANALILYAMVASKQHKKQLLIFNQNVLDLFSSILLVIIYGAKLCNIPLIGSVGYWLCKWLLSENILWCVVIAAKFNLIFVTIERYVKVVHRTKSKKILRKWVIYATAVFSWIAGFAISIGITLTTTEVIDGVCYAYVFWSTRASQLAYGIFYFMFFLVFITAIFIFCYGRILIVIRHQASVMASHSTTGSSTQQQQKANHLQVNIVKTMVFVSVFYVISDLPMDVYYLLLNINTNMTIIESGYYTALFVSFFYICANPFVYAAKFEPVKRILIRLIPCRKTLVQPNESVEMADSTATRTAQQRY